MATSYTNAQILEVLKRARDKISNPKVWIQGAYKRNAPKELREEGIKYQYCSIGAVGASLRELGMATSAREEIGALLKKNIRVPKSQLWRQQSVEGYQDQENRKHAQVIQLFDRTITQLEKDVAKNG